jgi:hypothetical protein
MKKLASLIFVCFLGTVMLQGCGSADTPDPATKVQVPKNAIPVKSDATKAAPVEK